MNVIDRMRLLDIKPYVPDFEPRQEVGTGWLEGTLP